MKYSILLFIPLFVGCSLIKINQEQPPQRPRPEILTVSAYSCLGDNDDCNRAIDVSIARSKIVYFLEEKNLCFVKLEGNTFPEKLDMTCEDFKEYLNQ